MLEETCSIRSHQTLIKWRKFHRTCSKGRKEKRNKRENAQHNAVSLHFIRTSDKSVEAKLTASK